ncbi:MULTISPECIES: hypothetical protein [Nocardia]|uniref:hypothetical protein n=1 Tax=Nocardia TaxID=1817 RepID=UPI0024558C59|nr:MULTISPECIES: hypothetical protein [Nocardia]
MQPATSPRRPTALYNAVTASRDLIRESIEYPTIRPENTSLTARPDPAGLASPGLAEHTPPPVRKADPPRGPPGHRFTRRGGLVGEEPVPELRIVAMSVD